MPEYGISLWLDFLLWIAPVGVLWCASRIIPFNPQYILGIWFLLLTPLCFITQRVSYVTGVAEGKSAMAIGVCYFMMAIGGIRGARKDSKKKSNDEARRAY